MKQTLFEQLCGTYTRPGDYLLPGVKLPDQSEHEIGVWGQRRRRFLKEHHRVFYYNMLTKCTLCPHLADIGQQAQRMFDRLVDELSEKEGITAQLKAENQMLWVQRINNIRSRAMEMVNSELIYAYRFQGTIPKACLLKRILFAPLYLGVTLFTLLNLGYPFENSWDEVLFITVIFVLGFVSSSFLALPSAKNRRNSLTRYCTTIKVI